MIDLRSACELVSELAKGVRALFRTAPVEVPTPGELTAVRHVLAEVQRAIDEQTVHVACHPDDAAVFRHQLGELIRSGLVEVHRTTAVGPGKVYTWTGTLLLPLHGDDVRGRGRRG